MSEGRLKYIYFNVRGRGEVARLLFTAAEQSYEEQTVDLQKEWPAYKPATKHSVLPEIEVDGVLYSQSLAINTYLARKFGLYATTDLECLQIEEIQHLREDLLVSEATCHFEKDETAKATQTKKLMDETYPRYLGIFSDIIKKNGTGYSVGNKLTLGDIVIFEAFTTLSQTNPGLLQKYQHVTALREKVANADALKDYIARRKVTPL